MIFSGDELFAIKVVAVATPVAGLAAFAHVRARRRRARAIQAERARNIARTAVIEVRADGAENAGWVSVELTPHLLACLAAANSAQLRGYPTPDSVMMAPAVEATWKPAAAAQAAEFQAAGKLIVTREFVKVRSSSRSTESIRVPLRELLEAHRTMPEGRVLYCESEGPIASTPPRALRVAPARAPKDFYWVRAEAAAKASESSSGAKREI